MNGKRSNALHRTVYDFIHCYQSQLMQSGKLVVAVSGGPDSVCLLHILADLRREMDLDLHVAHLNHGLRAGDSDEDALYVSRLAAGLGLPATVERRDVRVFRKGYGASEEAAREVRYRFLAEVASSISASAIVTGHTADDQVETILMHLVRGSGTRGLRGMQPVSTWRSSYGDWEVRIARPLMTVFREETAEYCRNRGLDPRTDSSNLSLTFLRNRVRAELLPLLRKYNPRIRQALLKMARIAGDDHDLVLQQSEARARRIVRRERDGLTLTLPALARLGPAMQRTILFSAIERLRGKRTDIEASHVEQMMEALSSRPGATVSLPGGLVFYRGYTRCGIAPSGELGAPFPAIAGESSLKVPGITSLPGWRVEGSILPQMPHDDPSPYTAFLGVEPATTLVVRARRGGDLFQPLGMEQDKKLQDFMVDEKIPRWWRDGVPLVCVGDRIAWVVGYRIAQWARVLDLQCPVLRLRFERRAKAKMDGRQ